MRCYVTATIPSAPTDDQIDLLISANGNAAWAYTVDGTGLSAVLDAGDIDAARSLVAVACGAARIDATQVAAMPYHD